MYHLREAIHQIRKAEQQLTASGRVSSNKAKLLKKLLTLREVITYLDYDAEEQLDK